jgi:hypothetical protein
MLYPVELRARRKVYHEARQLHFCSTGIPAGAAGRPVKIVDLARRNLCHLMARHSAAGLRT